MTVGPGNGQTTAARLVAQTTVPLTITLTTPGLNFNVTPGQLFASPLTGAQFPTSFQATIQNLRPGADNRNLKFSKPPSGLATLNSGTSFTVATGQTGILGVTWHPPAAPSRRPARSLYQPGE